MWQTRGLRSVLLMSLATLGLCGLEAHAQLLLSEDFAAPDNVDTTVWRLPFGTEGTFVGRTQYRGDPATDIPLQGIDEPLATDGKVLEIDLDTYSPIDPGNQFLGTDLLTKRNFARAGGLVFEARLRLKPSVPGGLVGGFFVFDVPRETPPGTPVRDEIDWELISNQTTGAATNDPYSNFWNDGPFDDGGSGQFHDVAGLDLTQFQDYRVEWTPQNIKWFVNGALVRTQSSNVPDDPMRLHFNLWAPDSSFEAAFDEALQPAATAEAGQTYKLQVDHLEVNRIQTISSDNLLVDPSFEDFNLTSITPDNGGLTDTWLTFGNVSIEPDDPDGIDPNVPDMAPDGIFMAKAFGPFAGQSDASGFLQNVPALAGEEFEARVQAQTPSGDGIAGTENFNTIALSFLDSNGDLLETEAFQGINQKDFPLLDGRDPNMPEDQFVEGVVNAIAPAGTAFARVSLLFVQLNEEGGASWFDDVSLVRLTPDVVFNEADFDRDGDVDGDDFLAWQTGFGTSSGALKENGDFDNDEDVDGDDFLGWQANFGLGEGAGAATAVPEPATGVLALLAALMGIYFWRR